MKILLRKYPVRLLRRIAEEKEGEEWTVKRIDERFRTEAGRWMFCTRVRRKWHLLDRSDKEMALTNTDGLQNLKKEIATWDLDWVLSFVGLQGRCGTRGRGSSSGSETHL